jgi:hypothetical protein
MLSKLELRGPQRPPEVQELEKGRRATRPGLTTTGHYGSPCSRAPSGEPMIRAADLHSWLGPASPHTPSPERSRAKSLPDESPSPLSANVAQGIRLCVESIIFSFEMAD